MEACAQLLRNAQALRFRQPCECPSICSSFTPKMSFGLCSAKSHSSLPPAARCRSPQGDQAPEGDLLEISRLAGSCDLCLRTEMNQIWPGPGPTIPLGPFPQLQEFLRQSRSVISSPLRVAPGGRGRQGAEQHLMVRALLILHACGWEPRAPCWVVASTASLIPYDLQGSILRARHRLPPGREWASIPRSL